MVGDFYLREDVEIFSLYLRNLNLKIKNICRRGKITKVIIQEHNYSDEVEIELDGYELRQKEDGTWISTKKPRINPSDLKEGVEILYTVNLEAVDSSCFDFELTGKIIALQEDAGEKHYITSLGHIITEDKIIEIL